MSETPRPLWELVREWSQRQTEYPPSEGGEAAAAAVRCCARELLAALRAWDEYLTVQIVGEPTNTHIKQQLLGVPPKEPAQKDQDS